MDTKKLKKAYHTGKLAEFFDEMLANGEKINKKEIEKYLTKFEKERDKTIKEFSKWIKIKETPSVVQEGKKLSEEEKLEIYKNVKEAEKLLNRYKHIANEASANSVLGDLQNIGHAMTGYMVDLKRFRILMYQKYLRKMFANWQNEPMLNTRKEAEDYTQQSKEYYDWKTAQALEDACEDAMINCRKELSKY